MAILFIRLRSVSGRWDALGAGDAFTAGFAVSLCQGRPLKEALRRGAACGALAVTKLGVSAGLPFVAEVEALIA